MSRFKEYLEAKMRSSDGINFVKASSVKNTTKKFKSRKDFDTWLKSYLASGGKLSDEIKIQVPNVHGNVIIYDSPLDVINEA